MVLSFQSTGQMCNRIASFVQSLATAIDCEQDLVHFNADAVFSFTQMHPEALHGIRVLCKSHPTLCKYVDCCVIILCKVFKSFPRWYYSGNAQRCEKWRKQGNKRMIPIVHWSWYLRNEAASKRHRSKICAFLRVKDEYLVRPKSLIESFRAKCDVIVGVHMRRGDYKTWANGKYYFDDATMLRFMNDFTKSCPPDIKVGFVLVSNEPIDADAFKRHVGEVIVVSGLPQEDIVSLSMCDFVMGPPSTFSWWAAYYGDKPLLHIHGADENVHREHFQKIWSPKSLFD